MKRYWQCADNKIEGSSTDSEKNSAGKYKGRSTVKEQKKSYRVRLGEYWNVYLTNK